MNIEKGMIIGFSKMGESLAIENIAEVKEYNSNFNATISIRIWTYWSNKYVFT